MKNITIIWYNITYQKRKRSELMSTSLKICGRVLVMLFLMAVGAWLNGRLSDKGSYTYFVLYIVYFLIGITLATTINPRFTKGNNKWVYFIPVAVFAIVGAQWFFYPVFSVASLPFGIGNYVMQFSYLSWALVGFFANLAFR